MKVRVSAVLLRYTNNLRVIEIDAHTVGDALQGLCRQHPALKPILFTADGRLSKLNRIYLGEEPIDADPAQPLQPDDQLEIITAVAGG